LERALRPLGGQLPPLPTAYAFRDVLLQEVQKEWPAIAKEVVKLAKAGNPTTLRQVLQIVLEGDDDGAARYWQILLAGAAQSRAARAAPPAGDSANGLATDDAAELSE
jgi:hypothetical protein